MANSVERSSSLFVRVSVLELLDTLKYNHVFLQTLNRKKNRCFLFSGLVFDVESEFTVNSFSFTQSGF